MDLKHFLKQKIKILNGTKLLPLIGRQQIKGPILYILIFQLLPQLHKLSLLNGIARGLNLRKNQRTKIIRQAQHITSQLLRHFYRYLEGLAEDRV
jgi:hypothetical protein